jgi:hypothetical protein
VVVVVVVRCVRGEMAQPPQAQEADEVVQGVERSLRRNRLSDQHVQRIAIDKGSSCSDAKSFSCSALFFDLCCRAVLFLCL